ncbi:MAG: hypothetical protein WAV11_01390 [Minisyncoccia bacterium]
MKNTHPKLFKFLRWSLLVAVSLVVVFIIASFYIAKNEKNLILGLEQIKYDMYMKPFLDEQARLETARKLDNIGGQTPEETLDMYIEALKREDLDGAVKLYEIAEQDRKKQSLESSFLREVAMNVEEIKRLGKGELHENGYYSIGYIYTEPETISTTTLILGQMVPGKVTKGATSTIEKVFIKNPYTNIWKIVF